jgi:mannosyltransferase OCH1-like enzyme
MTDILIPTLFHWIWFGTKPLPEQHQRWIKGWLDLHPRWEHVRWTEENRPPLVNEQQFQQADSFAQKADIARYEIIHRYGGIYLDTDVECLRCIEPLLPGVAACLAAADEGRNSDEHLGNWIIGGAPGHPWLKEVIARLPAAMVTGFRTVEQTGPQFLTSVSVGRGDITVLPRPLFCHHRHTRLTEAYAVHHATSSWFAGEGDKYSARLRQVLNEEIQRLVPPNAVLILVGKGCDFTLGEGRRVLPFPEQNGHWAGYPADDSAAIAELNRLRDAGAEFIVFPAPMFYWFDAYRGLKAYLTAEGGCVVNTDRVVIYGLRS